MSEAATDLLNQVDQHLNHPNQAWLLGAGISKDAGLPLMMDLTAQVFKKSEGKAHAAVLNAMKAELPAEAHIEHMLSQLGDYMAIAKRVVAKTDQGPVATIAQCQVCRGLVWPTLDGG